MEILLGHQYVKSPQDRYAIFANTYYLGHVDLKDKDTMRLLQRCRSSS